MIRSSYIIFMPVIAFDSADDVVYNGPNWVNGQNGGFGWGAWTIPCSSFTGGVYTLGNSNLNGASPIGPGAAGGEAVHPWTSLQYVSMEVIVGADNCGIYTSCL